MSTPLAQRVAALVVDEGHRRLLARLRAGLERGGEPASMQLRGLDADERRALADLLGSDQRPDGDVRVVITDLDRSLRRSRVGAGLVEVLEELGGPLRDRRAERATEARRWEQLWSEARDAPGTPDGADVPVWRAAWVDGLRRGTLRRLATGVPHAQALLADASAVLDLLPTDDTHIATLAARVTGDPHALDPGRPLAVLVQAGVAARLGLPPDQPGAARERRELWAAVGVQCDPLSVTTLVLGVRPEGDSLLATTMRAHADAGEPLRLTLRQIVGATLTLHGGLLHVCENPSVVASAADELGAACAPLLCVEGVPSTATHALLDALQPLEEVRVHADFDAGGVRIGNLLMGQPGAVPWRFDAAAYREALATVDEAIALRGPVDDASWDPDLAPAMTADGRAVHEEQVMDHLVADLQGSR